VAVPDGSRAIRLCDVATGQGRVAVWANRFDVRSEALAFSPDGRTLATASGDGTVRLWHVATGEELYTLGYFPGGAGYAARFSSDGRALVAAVARPNDAGRVIVWDGRPEPGPDTPQ
jgi:WD40 repeat protein